MIPRYEVCTVWPKGATDPFTGIATWGSPVVYQCEIARGGKTKLSDRSGAEFYPTSTFWVRSGDVISGTHTEPKESSMIARGNHDGTIDPSSTDAESVRGVMVHSNAKFGQADSYTIGTSA